MTQNMTYIYLFNFYHLNEKEECCLIICIRQKVRRNIYMFASTQITILYNLFIISKITELQQIMHSSPVIPLCLQTN